MSEGGEAQTNAVQVRTSMRLVARQDHGLYGKRNAKDYYPAGISIEGPQSLFQRSTGREESNRDSQLDRTGEDLAQGVGFWYAFLTSFWGPKTMVLSKREGLLQGPGLALSFPVFLGALVAVFLVVLVFFGRYLGCNSVPGQGLDSCAVVWLSFCCCFGWPFRCCLGCYFALCFCIVGCLGPGLARPHGTRLKVL